MKLGLMFDGRKTGPVTAHPFRRNLLAHILRERNRRATRFLSRIYSDLFKKTALAGVFLFGDAAVEAFSDGG